MNEGLRLRFHATALIAVMLVSGCAHTPKATSVPATGVIAGRVTDEHGPRQYANVLVKDMGSDYPRVQGKIFAAATGADGRYVIPNVPVGTYTVRSKTLGYAQQDRDSVRVSEHDTTIVNFKLKEIVVHHVDDVHDDVVH